MVVVVTCVRACMRARVGVCVCVGVGVGVCVCACITITIGKNPRKIDLGGRWRGSKGSKNRLGRALERIPQPS